MITTKQFPIPWSVVGPDGSRLSPITSGPWPWILLDGSLGADGNRSKFKAKITISNCQLSHK